MFELAFPKLPGVTECSSAPGNAGAASGLCETRFLVSAYDLEKL